MSFPCRYSSNSRCHSSSSDIFGVFLRLFCSVLVSNSAVSSSDNRGYLNHYIEFAHAKTARLRSRCLVTSQKVNEGLLKLSIDFQISL